MSAAAAVTASLKLGTAICLVIQRDTIQAARLVASLDQVSTSRFLFGIGCGWNAEEMEDHGTVYETRTKKMREQIEAMKEIWTKDKPEYHGEIVDFPPMRLGQEGVEAASAYHCRRRLPLRRAPRDPLRGRDTPGGAERGFAQPKGVHAALAPNGGGGRPGPQLLSVMLGGAPEDIAVLHGNHDLGVARMTVRPPPAKEGGILPIFDRWAKLIPQVRN